MGEVWGLELVRHWWNLCVCVCVRGRVCVCLCVCLSLLQNSAEKISLVLYFLHPKWWYDITRIETSLMGNSYKCPYKGKALQRPLSGARKRILTALCRGREKQVWVITDWLVKNWKWTWNCETESETHFTPTGSLNRSFIGCKLLVLPLCLALGKTKIPLPQLSPDIDHQYLRGVDKTLGSEYTDATGCT